MVCLLNPTNGSLNGTWEDMDLTSHGPAIAANGTVYIPGCNRRLLAFNPPPASALRWQYPPEGGSEIGDVTSPAIGDDGTVYFGTWNPDMVVAVWPDGTFRWSQTLTNDVHSSPAIGDDGTVYIGCNDDKLYAFRGDNGAPKWPQPCTLQGDVESSPAVGTNGLVYVTDSWNLYAVNQATGAIEQTIDFSDHISFDDADNHSPVIGADGKVYVVTQYAVYCFNPDLTDVLWRSDFTAGENGASSSPSIGPDGALYVGYDDKLLQFLP
jgi:outer membrane protein assembly factor BamB